MNEESSYEHGDIVWVKLGSNWWPGEVIDFEQLAEDIKEAFKKPPLVCVTFFQEDSYEFVKNLANICKYNCPRKDDFIKKGMDQFRNKNTFMEKFPADICTAERRTNGNINILADPKYGPDKKKENYAALIFGTPSPKKAAKDSPKNRPGKSNLKSSRYITHPRFIGLNDDHQVRVMVQNSDVDSETETSPVKTYTCSYTCGFSSTRIDVIVIHNKTHTQGIYTAATTSKTAKRPPKKVLKMTASKTNSIDDDLALLAQGLPITGEEQSDEELEDRKPRKKTKVTKDAKETKLTPKPPKIFEEVKEAKTDIRVDLLAEWDEDEVDDVTPNTSKIDELSKKIDKELDKSCFDFSEDEDKPILSASPGRKIPRVLPDKSKSTESEIEPKVSQGEIAEVILAEKGSAGKKDLNKLGAKGFKGKGKLKKTDNNDLTDKKTVENENLAEDFKMKEFSIEIKRNIEMDINKKESKTALEKDLHAETEFGVGDDIDLQSILEATTVPKLPEIPQLLKCEQNFHNARTIKFPDKDAPINTAATVQKTEVVATKLTNPKKRFVKSFEDFELSLREKSKLDVSTGSKEYDYLGYGEPVETKNESSDKLETTIVQPIADEVKLIESISEKVKLGEPVVEEVKLGVKPAKPIVTDVKTVKPQVKLSEPSVEQVKSVKPELKAAKPVTKDVKLVKPIVKEVKVVKAVIKEVKLIKSIIPEVKSVKPIAKQVTSTETKTKGTKPLTKDVKLIEQILEEVEVEEPIVSEIIVEERKTRRSTRGKLPELPKVTEKDDKSKTLDSTNADEKVDVKNKKTKSPSVDTIETIIDKEVDKPVVMKTPKKEENEKKVQSGKKSKLIPEVDKDTEADVPDVTYRRRSTRGHPVETKQVIPEASDKVKVVDTKIKIIAVELSTVDKLDALEKKIEDIFREVEPLPEIHKPTKSSDVTTLSIEANSSSKGSKHKKSANVTKSIDTTLTPTKDKAELVEIAIPEKRSKRSKASDQTKAESELVSPKSSKQEKSAEEFKNKVDLPQEKSKQPRKSIEAKSESVASPKSGKQSKTIHDEVKKKDGQEKGKNLSKRTKTTDEAKSGSGSPKISRPSKPSVDETKNKSDPIEKAQIKFDIVEKLVTKSDVPDKLFITSDAPEKSQITESKIVEDIKLTGDPRRRVVLPDKGKKQKKTFEETLKEIEILPLIKPSTDVKKKDTTPDKRSKHSKTEVKPEAQLKHKQSKAVSSESKVETVKATPRRRETRWSDVEKTDTDKIQLQISKPEKVLEETTSIEKLGKEIDEKSKQKIETSQKRKRLSTSSDDLKKEGSSKDNLKQTKYMKIEIDTNDELKKKSEAELIEKVSSEKIPISKIETKTVPTMSNTDESKKATREIDIETIIFGDTRKDTSNKQTDAITKVVGESAKSYDPVQVPSNENREVTELLDKINEIAKRVEKQAKFEITKQDEIMSTKTESHVKLIKDENTTKKAGQNKIIEDIKLVSVDEPKLVSFNEIKSVIDNQYKSVRADEQKSVHGNEPKSASIDETKSAIVDKPKVTKIEDRKSTSSSSFDKPKSSGIAAKSTSVIDAKSTNVDKLKTYSIGKPKTTSIDEPKSSSFDEPKSSSSELTKSIAVGKAKSAATIDEPKSIRVDKPKFTNIIDPMTLTFDVPAFLRMNEPKCVRIDDPSLMSIDLPTFASSDKPKSASIDKPKFASIDQPKTARRDDTKFESIDDTPKFVRSDQTKSASIDKPKSASIDKLKSASIDKPKSASIDDPKYVSTEGKSASIDKPRSASIDKPRSASIDKPRSASIDKPRSPSIDDSKYVSTEGKSVSIDKPKSASIDKPKSASIDKPKSASIDDPKYVSTERKSASIDDPKFASVEGKSASFDKPKIARIDDSKFVSIDVRKSPMDKPKPTSVDKPITASMDKPKTASMDTSKSPIIDDSKFACIDVPKSSSTDKPKSSGIHDPKFTSIDKPKSTGIDDLKFTSIDKPKSTGIDDSKFTSIDKPIDESKTGRYKSKSVTMKDNKAVSIDEAVPTDHTKFSKITKLEMQGPKSVIDTKPPTDIKSIIDLKPLSINKTTSDVEKILKDNKVVDESKLEVSLVGQSNWRPIPILETKPELEIFSVQSDVKQDTLPVKKIELKFKRKASRSRCHKEFEVIEEVTPKKLKMESALEVSKLKSQLSAKLNVTDSLTMDKFKNTFEECHAAKRLSTNSKSTKSSPEDGVKIEDTAVVKSQIKPQLPNYPKFLNKKFDAFKLKSRLGKIGSPRRTNIEPQQIQKLQTTQIKNVETSQIEKMESPRMDQIETPHIEKIETSRFEKIETSLIEKIDTSIETPRIEQIQITKTVTENDSSTPFDHINHMMLEMHSEKGQIPIEDNQIVNIEKIKSKTDQSDPSLENTPTEHKQQFSPLKSPTTAEHKKPFFPVKSPTTVEYKKQSSPLKSPSTIEHKKSFLATKSPRRLSLTSHESAIGQSSNKVEISVSEDVTSCTIESELKDIDNLQKNISQPESELPKEIMEVSSIDNLSNIPIGENREKHDVIDNTTDIKIKDKIITRKEDDIVSDTVSLKILEPSTSEAIKTLSSIEQIPLPDLISFDITKEQKEINVENVKVVSEKDLGEGQVEIANVTKIGGGRAQPMTIASFSVDYTGHDNFVKATPEIKVKKTEEKNKIEMEMAILTDTNIDQRVVQELQEGTTSKKLLEILTDTKKDSPNSETEPQTVAQQLRISNPKFEIDKARSKMFVKHALPGSSKSSRPLILSEKVIKPPVKEYHAVSVHKRPYYEDIEDIDAFIIQKPSKKISVAEEEPVLQIVPRTGKKAITLTKPKSKPTILGHHIIRPSGEVVQPKIAARTSSENVPSQIQQSDEFDIDSMPIVLTDQILTPETIENMPMIIEDSDKISSAKVTTQIKKIQPPQQMKLLNKTISPTMVAESFKTLIPGKTYIKNIKTTPKVFQTTSSPTMRHSPSILSQPSKAGKFIIVPSETHATPPGTRFTVGKRQIIKKTSPAILTGNKMKSPNVIQEPTGNKIMIVTNNQGHQSRVLLTPAQQKLMGYQTPKKIVKEVVVTKAPTANIISQTIINSKGQITTTTNTNYTASGSSTKLSPAVKRQSIEPLKNKIVGQRTFLNQIKNTSGQSRTILIKNPQGQTVKTIQGRNDALLEQQVAEQIKAINKAASAKAQLAYTAKTATAKRPYPKKITLQESSKPTMQSNIKPAVQSKAQMILNPGMSSTSKAPIIPPLAPISPLKKIEKPSPSMITKPVIKLQKSNPVNPPATAVSEVAGVDAPEQKRAPYQLVIQDALGNQTTIVEGQILALPSETTVDGQPQSYMLVTLDESGNLTPLNNEALMSLDPNLNLGGDLSNMVLQIDQGSSASETEAKVQQTISIQQPTAGVSDSPGVKQAPDVAIPPTVEQKIPVKEVEQKALIQEALSMVDQDLAVRQLDNQDLTMGQEIIKESRDAIEEPATMQAVACSINNGETNQQLIITGDPVATQKFLESLTEGNADLANLLANAEGNILIHADGNQILINTDSEANQMLLSSSADNVNIMENASNPIFSSPTPKSQDILAAALADTDVFQQEQSIIVPSSSKVSLSQLSPGIYPMSSNTVLETNTMISPIMSTLEMPSTNIKKIEDQDEILAQVVPKNVDLPITVTDPTIAHNVAQQQVALLAASNLHANLELPLSVQDVAVTSAEMNSPSYGYSLPSLDDSVDLNQKIFTSSISMPLLTEEPEDVNVMVSSSSVIKVSDTLPNEIIEKQDNIISDENSSLSFEKDSKSNQRNEDINETPCVKERYPSTSLSNQISNSSTEPPSDMFEFQLDGYDASSSQLKSNETATNGQTGSIPEQLNNLEKCDGPFEKAENVLFNVNAITPDVNSPNLSADDSCEIPVQPEIVTESSEIILATTSDCAKRSFEDDLEQDNKKCKFD